MHSLLSLRRSSTKDLCYRAQKQSFFILCAKACSLLAPRTQEKINLPLQCRRALNLRVFKILFFFIPRIQLRSTTTLMIIW